MNRKNYILLLAFGVLLCLPPSVQSAVNPDLIAAPDSLPAIDDIETAFEVVCDVGKVHNRITNNTVRPGGGNEWTILFGDDTGYLPSMTWREPEIYSNNIYLYYASLRIGRGDKLLHLSTDTSDTLIVSQVISDFDTDFYISDITPLVPPEDSLGLGVHQYSYAWDETDADDFIIYEFWIVNLNQNAIDSIYVALHADCDVSGASGGSGLQGFWRDDMVDYYRDDANGEYISFMYDGDNPNIPGNDIGGRYTPKESGGYIGSRLLYCPPIMGSSTPSIQQGHGWWDWNSDPGADEDWMILMRDGSWLDPPPSVHDYRFFQKLGPFEIAQDDSIKIAFAFGIGNGLYGMRSNLNNAHLLYENNYVYYDLPPTTPTDFRATAQGNDIEFSWSAISDTDFASYSIYQSTDYGSSWNLAAGGITDTVYSMIGPNPDFYYFYIVSHDLGANESMPSRIEIFSTLPQPPGNFRAISGNNSVSLSWSTVENATSYRIYRGNLSGGPYSQIAEVNHPGNSYTDINVTNYQTYYYVATTIKEGLESPYCGEVEVTPNPSQNGRVLLVDDYQELDQFGNLDFQKRRRFYERWGVYNFDYDVWSIGEQGMVPSSVITDYQAVLFASDGEVGESDGTWWYEIGSPGNSSLHYYMQTGGKLLAIGSEILPWIFNNIPPMPGDFEYDYFGIDSTGDGWANEWWFTWAVGEEPGYPDSMKIDVAKNGDQDDYASCVYSQRPGGDTLFSWGLWVDGNPPGPEYYQQPIGIIYRPGGTAISALMNFSLYFMPNLEARLTMTNILRDEFGCTYYEDPPPLPPWRVEVASAPSANLRVTWDAIDEDDVVYIYVERSVGGGPFSTIAQLAPDNGDYIDTGLNPGSVYSYRLKCQDFAGQLSYYSNTASEIAGRPPVLEGLWTESADGRVELYWDETSFPDIDSVLIYRQTNFAGNFDRLTSLSGLYTNYSDFDVTNGISYNYYATYLSTYGAESYPSDTVYAYPHYPGQRSGILIVNGIHGWSYGAEVYDLYYNRALTGDFDYAFWDLLDSAPSGGWPYPENIIGTGFLDPTVFNTYELIIWVGNSFLGDLEHWEYNLPIIMGYLNTGGNLMLPCRRGWDFLRLDLEEYAHIYASYSGVTLDSLVSQVDSLTDIAGSGVSLSSLVLVDTNYTEVLYRDVSYPDWVAGFYFDPGTSEGGKLVYLAGSLFRSRYIRGWQAGLPCRKTLQMEPDSIEE
jgi:fibronectin type 3 domain-containing protein